MKVYGYTNDKEVVLVELSIERICAAGIDPWRIDLLDSQPVPLEVDGQVLYFRHLRDVAFAYQRRNENRQAVICRHDGEETVCIVGDCIHFTASPSQTLQICNVQVSERPFVEHLAQYLELTDSHLWNTVPPQASKELTILGDRVTLNLKAESLVVKDDIPFMGEMKEETVVPVILDDRINWVFEKLSEFEPVVGAEAIIGSLACQSVTRIDVVINRQSVKVLTDELGAVAEGPSTRYVLDRAGCRYQFVPRMFPLRFGPLVDAMFLARQDDDTTYSIDALFCTRPNEVRGHRIGVYDLSLAQFRTLRRARPITDHTGGIVHFQEGARAAHYLDLGLTRVRNDRHPTLQELMA